MNWPFKVSMSLLAVLGTTFATAAFPQSQRFVPRPDEPIRTIALLQIPEPAGYYLGESGSEAGQVFGIVGLAIDMQAPEHPEYERAGFRFSGAAERLLTAHLKAAGFSVISVPVERKKPHRLLVDYKALSVPNVDAYLDVVAFQVGYRKSTMGGPFSSKVGPVVSVVARLVSARSKDVLYADTIEYGWSKARMLPSKTAIDAPKNYVFKNKQALLADMRRGIAQLEEGTDTVTRTVAATLLAGITEAKAWREKWTQVPIPDLHTIASKWEGSGITADGEEFLVKISFEKDGSYVFRDDRTTQSGMVRAEKGIIMWGSAGPETVTAVLYEDVKGNRALKARRVDGLTWTAMEVTK